MFSFSLIDLDPLKQRPIDRNKENTIFLWIQELMILYAAFVSQQFVLPEGVKLPCSVWSTSSLHYFFFLFSFMVQNLPRGMFLYLDATGVNNVTSNNAFWPDHQNPLAEMTNRASSCLLAVLAWKCSLERLCSYGSIWISLRISFTKVAVIFLTWLCRTTTNPPFLQNEACCNPNFTPYTQFSGRRVNSQPYRTCIRFQKMTSLIPRRTFKVVNVSQQSCPCICFYEVTIIAIYIRHISIYIVTFRSFSFHDTLIFFLLCLVFQDVFWYNQLNWPWHLNNQISNIRVG